MTMDNMPVGHLTVIATVIVETIPEPFPSYPNWNCFITNTVEQHHYISRAEIHSHVELQVANSIIDVS